MSKCEKDHDSWVSNLGYIAFVTLILLFFLKILEFLWYPFKFGNQPALKIYGFIAIACLIASCTISLRTCVVSANIEKNVDDKFTKIIENDYLVVKSNNGANLRKGASTGKPVILRLKKDTSLKFLRRDGNWLMVLFEEKKEGYIFKKIVKLKKEDSKKGITAIVNTRNRANIRENPTTKASIIDMVNNGTELEYIESAGDWYKVRLDLKSKGFIHKSVVSLSEATEERIAPEDKSVFLKYPLLFVSILLYFVGAIIAVGTRRDESFS